MATDVIKLFAIRTAAQFLPHIHVANTRRLQFLFEVRLIVLRRKLRIGLRTSIGHSFYIEPFEQIKEVLDGVVRMSDTH